jgi:hypothetical protein
MMTDDDNFGILYITITKHVEELEKYNRKQDMILDTIRADQQRILEQQQAQAVAIQNMHEQTKGIIRFTEDVQAAARLAAGIQKVATWLAKFGTVGIGLALTWEWVVKNTKW